MKKLLILALAAAAALPMFGSDFPKGSPDFKSSQAQVNAAAKKSGKPMILVFSAVWCPPCQAMKKEVFPSPAVQALHDKFEWAYLDVDDQKNAKAGAEFEVKGIPHFQFLDKDGKVLGKQIGGASPTDFAKTLNDILKKAGT
jgi:thioredoxin 1